MNSETGDAQLSREENVPYGIRERMGIFFQVADAISNPIYLLDVNRCYRDCNRGFERFMGLSKREIIGTAVFHELPADRVEREQLADPGGTPNPDEIRRVETTYRNRHGKEFEVIVTCAVLPPDGAPEAILCVLTDISDIKQAHSELRKASGMLEAVIKASPLPITMVDTNFFVRLWNPAAEQCFGFSKDQVIDKIYPLWPDRDKEADEALKRFNNDEVLYGSEVLRKKNDGTIIRVKRYTSPVRDRSGELIGTMAVLEDMTEQIKTESELLQASKMAAIGELASGIAHEINNPNMFMMTNAQVLSEVWEDVSHMLKRHADEHAGCLIAGLSLEEALESVPALLQGLVEGSFRIRRIVETLKDFYRQEDTSSKTLVDLRKVIESSVFMLENLIKKTTDRFQLSCEDRLPPVRGNFHQLEQVIINVVLNALQALKCREDAVNLTVSHNLRTEMIDITVRDKGVGMGQETLERILDPFFTTRLDKGGSGLGLSISNRIVKQHGGTLRFESLPGQGTTTVISLPTTGSADDEDIHEPDRR
jgi:PAS domain S-box-containing protein